MGNPFEVIDGRLDKIEALLSELKNCLESTLGAEPDAWLDMGELLNYLPEKPRRATVYSWVNKKLIPYYKGGKKLRFLKSEIDSWLKNGRRKTIAEIREEASGYRKR